MIRILKGFLITLAVLAIAVGIEQFWFYHRAQPEPTQRQLFPGVVYTREVWQQPRPVVVHVLTIDLTTLGLRFKVTPGDPTRQLPFDARTTSGYLAETGAQIAVNADFFGPWVSNAPWDYYPHVGDPVKVDGRTCSEGVCYNRGSAYSRMPSLFLRRDGHAFIGSTPPDEPIFNVVSGNEFLLVNGSVAILHGQALHPRTAVGLDAAQRQLVLVVVDGRQPGYSEGVTTRELAALFQRYGASTAFNMDGGGSATMAVQGEDGRPQVLNCTIDNHIPGRERPVANHLAIFVPKQ